MSSISKYALSIKQYAAEKKFIFVNGGEQLMLYCRSFDNANMADVVGQDCIHNPHINTENILY